MLKKVSGASKFIWQEVVLALTFNDKILKSRLFNKKFQDLICSFSLILKGREVVYWCFYLSQDFSHKSWRYVLKCGGNWSTWIKPSIFGHNWQTICLSGCFNLGCKALCVPKAYSFNHVATEAPLFKGNIFQMLSDMTP